MNMADLGMDRERLERVPQAIAADVEAERYDGGVVLVARAAHCLAHLASGTGWQLSAPSRLMTLVGVAMPTR